MTQPGNRSPEAATAPKAGRCPICGRPAAERYRPFCSSRCADVDLHRWLGGHYAIPAAEPPDFAEQGGPSSGDRPKKPPEA